MKESEATANR